jgi:hypothetical protein
MLSTLSLLLQRILAKRISFSSDFYMSNEVEDGVVRHEVALINGVHTKISSVVPKVENGRVCIVVIPGNPGSIEFYDIFIESLFKESGGKIPVYGVGHAGMDVVRMLCFIFFE